VILALGAPAALLAEATTPIAPEPFVPEVSTPVKLTIVMLHAGVLCENDAVTVTLES
jgi:hypothetical protein